MNLVDKAGNILTVINYKANEHNVLNVTENEVTLQGYKGVIVRSLDDVKTYCAEVEDAI